MLLCDPDRRHRESICSSVNLPKRLELSLRKVLALPKLSKSGLEVITFCSGNAETGVWALSDFGHLMYRGVLLPSGYP